MLNSVITGSTMNTAQFMLCLGMALLLGGGCAFLAAYHSRYTRSLLLVLGILPAVAMMMILLVNGNLGVGLAVAGTFSLVRFRSAAGSGRQIGLIFLATALGVACGQGYLVLALVFFTVMALVILGFGMLELPGADDNKKLLKIDIPEELEYDGLFDDVLKQYTTDWELVKVKTANMGTMYELGYEVAMKDSHHTKEMLDEIRTRNGNLKVVLAPMDKGNEM